jgi:glycosyltransferase involved in cell wall biosynthesis
MPPCTPFFRPGVVPTTDRQASHALTRNQRTHLSVRPVSLFPNSAAVISNHAKKRIAKPLPRRPKPNKGVIFSKDAYRRVHKPSASSRERFRRAMKIGIVAGSYPPDVKGGGEISTELLARILTRAGCEVFVLAGSNADLRESQDNIRIHRIPSPNIYWDLDAKRGTVKIDPLKKLVWHLKENINPRARKSVTEFIDDYKPDVLVTSTIENFGGEAWAAAHQAGVPSVHLLRSYWPFCVKGSAVKNGRNCDGRCLDCAVFTWGRRKDSQLVPGVIGISDYILKRHLQQGLFSHADTVIIPEPMEEEFFISAPRSGHQKRFAYLGVISPDKGLETLLAAWNKASLPNASLSIAGKGNEAYVDNLKKSFGSDVSFKGWVESTRYLDEIDFLIVPSVWNEPFGRIVIEAFARAVPVIGSNIAGIGENVRDAVSGYVFPPGDSDHLAATLKKSAQLSPQQYAALSERALTGVTAYASIPIARAHINFYEKIIRKPAAE